MRIAVLDDYQNVAKDMANWSTLGPKAAVSVFSDHLTSEDAVADRLKGFDVVVGMRERTAFPKTLLSRLPDLKLLITTGMANASFDVDAATELGITVAGTGGVAGDPTAELTWGLLLSLTRHIGEEQNATREGKWQTTVGTGLKGKTIGIIGLGRIGSEIARYSRAFQMNVVAWSQNLTKERAAECGAALVTKDDLLKQADFVTIHLRLSARTQALIGARELALMKPTALLLNTSRGPIVDERALVQAIDRGIIGGAGLDVFDEEPLPLNHPLRSLKHVVITPHLGYVTAESYRTMYSDAIQDIQALGAGEPIRVINQAVLQKSTRRKLELK